MEGVCVKGGASPFSAVQQPLRSQTGHDWSYIRAILALTIKYNP
jgi:hypothetical protein